MTYFRESAAYVVSDEILEGYSGGLTTVLALPQFATKGGQVARSAAPFRASCQNQLT